MILENELMPIGKALKPHGVKGEFALDFDMMCFDEDNLPFLVFEMDGLFVPFFIDLLHVKSNCSAWVKLDGIDTEEAARQFSGKTIYLHLKYKVEADDEEADETLVGYDIYDKTLGLVGKIKDIDDSTMNTLFIVDRSGVEIMIPAVDEFVVEVDDDKKRIEMNLPQGLVNLDEAEDE